MYDSPDEDFAQSKVHLTAMTISQIARISIMVYDIGLIRKTGAFDPSLFTLFAVRFVPMAFLITTIPAAIVERVFASYYIRDYENAKRAWISYLINGSSFVIAAAYYLVLQSLAIGLYMTVLLLFITLLIFVLPAFAMMVVHRRDTAKLRDLDNESGISILNYTLSIKFQLEENVRVSKFVFNASIGYAMWGTVGTLMGVVTWAIFKEEHPISQLFAALINIYIALSFAIAVWLSLVAIGKPRTLAKLFTKCISMPISISSNWNLSGLRKGNHSEENSTKWTFSHQLYRRDANKFWFY
ncbi:unnamed protein product [Cylicocyclus nassatus]|uniref:Uncharacterized protein n=1 Tax=Cylicocyclus nassatus TaxID=53992 RepID=A0AA36GIP5_CYLNA|nr:unnamed protein product [Cylicocyclus nassatus]